MQRVCGGLVLVGRYTEGLACAACVRWTGACRQVHRRASLCSVCVVLSGLVLVSRYIEGLACAACAVLSGGLVLVSRYIEGLACAACVRC